MNMPNTVCDLLKELQALKTKEEAKTYMHKLLEMGNPHMWSNIKYVVGYLGNEERTRILDLFN